MPIVIMRCNIGVVGPQVHGLALSEIIQWIISQYILSPVSQLTSFICYTTRHLPWPKPLFTGNALCEAKAYLFGEKKRKKEKLRTY